MKKPKWMDVVIASPMVLTFAFLGGWQGVVIAVPSLVLATALLKWGISFRTINRKPVAIPARAR